MSTIRVVERNPSTDCDETRTSARYCAHSSASSTTMSLLSKSGTLIAYTPILAIHHSVP
ncbi:hypothetical protein M407DRAFT_173982 [Tulasnella calospora MUT 4182]|uniref:Uncharacterized protein n=1 Tax=Tulasnella calospora MUT 4182 TaxID=1051891 RepID=A0A0C3L5L7_9AGAM|nr:hypothetical protein M407DRAFT_173982 [Tulasnella calospora MUT 4182]